MYDNITAAMIVKNEATCLERCLESVVDIMPIVIADTGSTDDTMEIARVYTAEVYEHPWQDSFSEARNWIKGKVKTKWALQIDADEEVPAISIPELDKLDDQHSAYMTPIHNVIGGTISVHQFERIYQPAKCHYEWRVHNQLVIDEGKAALSRFSFLHYGYDASPEELKTKYANTLRMLLMDIDDAGYIMRNVRFLIQTYRSLERHVDVLAVLGEHLNKLNAHPGIYQEAAAGAIVAYNALGDNVKAKAAGVKLLKEYPESLDALFYLGVAYMQDEAWQLSLDCFARYIKVRASLQLEGTDHTVVYHTWGSRAEVFQNMGICTSFLGNKIQASLFFMRAEMLAKHKPDIAGYAANTDNALCLLLGDSQPAQAKIVQLTEPDSWDKPKKQLLTMEAD